MTEQETFERLSLRYEKYEYGERWYNQFNQLHRVHGPAVVLNDGSRFYYQEDILHREDDLPAVEKVDGTRKWFNLGARHRLVGPAAIYPDGRKFYFIMGQAYKREKFYQDPRVIEALDKLQDS